MVGGKVGRVVLVLFLVVALSIKVYSILGTCYDEATGACSYIEEEECEPNKQFYPGQEPSDVPYCDIGCCCEAKFSFNPVYPQTRGECELVYESLFLDVGEEECYAICEPVTPETPLCNANCEYNPQQCVGRQGQIIDTSYYCWEKGNAYLVQSVCLSDCYVVGICYDGIKNGDETDIDCGGSCPKCEDGKNCLSRYDCIAGFCNSLNKCGCVDYDNDGHQDIKCGGDDCNDNNDATIKCPVLLVHGYMVINPNGTWHMMKDWLKKDGFDVYEIDLEPWILPANGDITDYANKLDDKITGILENTKSAKIDIVAHSMGGLVSRWYSRFGYKGNIRNIIMLGTPNHGSELFYGKYALSILSKFLIKLKLIDKIADFVLGDAGKQMTPYSFFLNMLNHNNPLKTWGTDDILTLDIGHHTMAGTNDFWLTTAFLFEEDDGLVRVESVKLDGSDTHEQYYLTHSQLTKNLTLYNDVKYILETPGLSGMFGEMALPPEEIFSKTQEAFYLDDNIQENFKIYNLTISYSNISMFLLSWYSEDTVLGLNLIMPNGTLINETVESINATYYPANISQNDTMEGFVVDDPTEGIWQAKVILKEGAKTNYTFMVLLETDLRILILTDKSNYGLNEPINLTVNLTNFEDPILDSDVKTSIKKPDGLIKNITLYDDGTHGDRQAGDGSYFNVYYSTDLLGIYEITAIANGELNDEDYYRQTTIQTEIYEPIDLYLNESDIYFSNSTPITGQEIQISALIHNKGNVNLENISVQFYNDDPAHYGELIGKDLIDISANSFANATISWNATMNCRYIFVLISPFNSFLEEDHLNNLANKSIEVKRGPECPILQDSMVINKSMTLCKRVHYLPNGITITADNITLDCNGATLIGNNSPNFLLLDSLQNITIKNCIIKGYVRGLILSKSDNNFIINNRFENNSFSGLSLGKSKNNLINNAVFINNYIGFLFFDSEFNTLINSDVITNTWGGYLSNSPSSVFRNNSFLQNIYNFGMDYPAFSDNFNQDIDISNKINNKPIYYLSNVDNTIYDNLYAGYLAIVSSNNITVRNMNLTDGSLYIINSTNSTITNNNLLTTDIGLIIEVGDDMNILNNNISAGLAGVLMQNSKNVTFINNNIFNNDDGLYIVDDGSIYFDFYTENTLINYNNIFNNSDYNLRNTKSPTNAQYNWWGTTNKSEIEEKILDYYDYGSLGVVYYEPFLLYPFGTELTLFNISLNQGWNLISIPLDLTDKDVNSVFGDFDIYGYNGSWFVPEEIDNKLGYWVRMNENKNITVEGAEIENKTIELNKGWNLVGYPSLNSSLIDETLKDVGYSAVYGYNGSWSSYAPFRDFNSLDYFVPGYGYWIFVSGE